MADVKTGIGGELAKTLITARIVAAQEGEVGSVPSSAEPGAAKVDGFVLPGAGAFVRFDEGGERAQMFCPGGAEPLSVEMDLRNSGAFASFMHNVDVEIMRAPERGSPARNRSDFPKEVLEFVDAAVLSSDLALSSVATRALSGRPVFGPASDGPWEMPKALAEIAEAACDSGDAEAEERAKRAVSVSGDPSAGSEFDSLRSIARWGWQLDRVLTRSAGMHVEDIECDGGFRWRPIWTEIGGRAACAEIGRGMREMRLLLGSDFFREEREGYALVDKSGQTVGVYARNDGEPVFKTAEGRAPDSHSGMLKALDTLFDTLGGSRSPKM